MKKLLITILLISGLFPATRSWAEEEQTWKINLKEAEIRAFITQVADITEKSFVIDPRVKGKVTVISHSSLTQDEVYELFLSVLHVHNFTAVPSVDGLIKIVPSNTATKDTIRLDANNRIKGEELVTRVIAVKNTPANELIPVLRPMVAQHGHLAAVPSANSIIISDHGANIERILQIIDKIDGAESEEIEVIQLKEAWVTDIVTLLENLTPVETGSASRTTRGPSGPSGGGSTRVRVVADERTNRLILKGEKSARARVRSLVEKLDTPAEVSSGATQVIYLRYADAGKVAEILTNLVSKSEQAQRSTSKSAGTGKTAEDLGSVPTFIQADESLNALVVMADPASMEEIRDIVRQIDVRRAQVLIEAAIVEVKGDAGRALGVQWGFGANEDNSAPVGGVVFGEPGVSLNTVALTAASASGSKKNDSSALGAAPGLANGLTLAGGKFNSDGDFQFGAFLQAVATTSNANILSTPSIVTMDNEEAEIIVGNEIPITTGSKAGDDLSNLFTTTERKDVGLTLKVTPQINEGDSIRLEIDQQASSLSTAASDVEAGANTITSKRSIKTTILAEDKEFIVLGGLVEEQDRETVTKVPVLGDIPLLGALFRNKAVQREKTNLLVFLKPTILRDSESSYAVSSGKYQKLRELQLEIDDKNGKISIKRKRPFPKNLNKIWTEFDEPAKSPEQQGTASNTENSEAEIKEPPTSEAPQAEEVTAE